MDRNYPVLDFLVKHGDRVAIATALAPVLAALVALAAGQSPWFLLAGLAVGAFLYLIMRSYIELVRLIVDMLLPK